MNARHSIESKVPAVTLGFWIIKIPATTLGETGGDTVTMTWLRETTSQASASAWHPGYLIGTAIFGILLAALVWAQIATRKFNAWLYWATIVASTTAGTTLADFADRSLGIGYPGGSLLLLACVLASLGLWYRSEGTVSVNTVNTPRVEGFYWLTITFSQTLGTALGDWTADDTGLGYTGAALVFGAALAVLAALYFWTRISHVLLVLGRLHSDAPARRDAWRFSRQAAQPWRPCAEQTGRVRSARGRSSWSAFFSSRSAPVLIPDSKARPSIPCPGNRRDQSRSATIAPAPYWLVRQPAWPRPVPGGAARTRRSTDANDPIVA